MSTLATPDGTHRFADRHAALGPEAYRSLGATGLLVSGVGFGCYRVDEDRAEHLGRSLARLGLDALDACLLHNPEYFLSDAAQRGAGTLAARREEFDRRMRDAFTRLEQECDAGRIGCYGVSSNAFVKPADDEEATSLTRML